MSNSPLHAALPPPPPSLQGPVALLQSYQEFSELVTTTVEEYVAAWEAGEHSLQESEAEVLRLSKVRTYSVPGLPAPVSLHTSTPPAIVSPLTPHSSPPLPTPTRAPLLQTTAPLLLSPHHSPPHLPLHTSPPAAADGLHCRQERADSELPPALRGRERTAG